AAGGGPAPAVAAVADAHLVGLLALGELAAPDREQPQHDALVGGAVEVVQLRRDLVVVARRVELVGAAPQGRRRVRAPLSALDHVVARLPVAALARLAPAVTQAVDPHLAERV